MMIRSDSLNAGNPAVCVITYSGGGVQYRIEFLSLREMYQESSRSSPSAVIKRSLIPFKYDLNLLFVSGVS